MTTRCILRIGQAIALSLLVLAPPALAESRIERDLALSPGGRLALEVDGGSVSVTGTPRSGARVVVTARREADLDDYDLRFDEDADGLSIIAKRKSELSTIFGGGSHGGLQFRIELPHETDIDISTAAGSIAIESIRGAIETDTSGGSISIEDIDGDVDATTSGGSVRIEGVRGNVKSDTGGGSTIIEEVSGRVVVQSSGGSIRITGAGDRVEADTSGGPIEVRFAPGAEVGGNLSTSGGGVRVWLDRSANIEIDAATSGGSVHCDMPITVQGRMSKTRLRGTIGAGGPLLTVRSSGGSIRIGEPDI